MASVVQICNSALNQLGAASITALTDNSKMQDYAMKDIVVRDAVFRSHPWNCPIKRQQLAQLLILQLMVLVMSFLYQVLLKSFRFRCL